ncbi:MAG: helix-turn-helix domain-containing protein [Anaerolineae bacterium]|nr:helix-turn-helix domain-containing protein [Anaerolineae bacterium]
MDDLLTTRQLEQLLQVDRITIYRMLDDGRLKGFKVGGHWRFPRAELEAWLRDCRQSHRVEYDFGSTSSERQPLPLACVQAIQSVFAEARGVASVTTDLKGNPLTDLSNSCGFCTLVRSTEQGRARCTASWRQAKTTPRPCHAGLQCAAAPVRLEGRPVAKAVSCQFALQSEDGAAVSWVADTSRLATDLGLDADELQEAAGRVHLLPEKDLPKMERLLRSVASTYAEIGRERLKLVGRLQRIAEITALDN